MTETKKIMSRLDPVVAKTTENTVWIYEKEGGYCVTPSPKPAEHGSILFFQNLTDEDATVKAPKLLDPDRLDLAPKDTKDAKVIGDSGKHPYKVKVDGVPAHGKSDPDLIIP